MQEDAFILQLGKTIAYAYFEDLNLDPLLSHFSDDIIWTGAGKQMRLTGRSAVSKAFLDGHNQRVPCIISNAEYIVRKLSNTTWLCQICFDLETDPSYKMFIHEYQRSVFIFQKNAASRSGDGWEIVYLNNSIAYNRLNDKEIFAVEYGMRNFQQYAAQKTADPISVPDKQRLYAYVQKNAFSFLSAAGKKLFLTMSLFPTFTSEQAAYMTESPEAADLLAKELERNAFLYFDYCSSTYSFHPLLESYLHYVFSKQEREWQNKQQSRAAHWYLQKGDYKEAILSAYRAGDYDTVLTAIEQAGRESLYGAPYAIADDTLKHCSAAERAAHLEGCFYCVIYLFRCQKPQLAARYLDVLAHCIETDLPDTILRPYYAAHAEALKGYCAYPDAAAMTKHVQTACSLLPASQEIILPWTFGSPSPLSLYHRSPGGLQEKTTELQQFTSAYIQLIHGNAFPAQTDFIRGEYDYLTGNLDVAEQTLTQYVHSNSVAPKCIAHLQTAHFYLARLAICRGDVMKLQQELQKLHALKLQVYPQCGTFIKKLSEAFICSMVETPASPAQLHILPAPSLDMRDAYYPTAPAAAVVQNKLLLSRGDFSQLLLKATDSYTSAIASSYILPAIYELILLACVYEHAGNMSSAAAALKEGIALAEKDSLVMPFAEHEEYIRQTLQQLQSDEAVSSFVEQVHQHSIAAPLSALRAALIKQSLPLSKREMEIAAMVAAGMTNKMIAQQLRLAEITVKKTLSQIYKKLNVANRTALANLISVPPPPIKKRYNKDRTAVSHIKQTPTLMPIACLHSFQIYIAA